MEKEGSSGGKSVPELFALRLLRLLGLLGWAVRTKRPVVVEDCGELGGGSGKTRERSPRR